MTSVSIVMATYNGARFLQEQLDSFVAQTRLPDELVATDDCSTDATVEILERFAARAPFPVRVERNLARLGVHRNFERAISLATGDIILISDQDDIWYPKKIETVIAATGGKPGVLALHHDEHILDQSSGRILDGTLAQRTQQLGGWDRKLAAGNCTVLRRESLQVLLPLPENFFYDEWINWVTDVLEARLVIDTPLQLWRRHGDNHSLPSVSERRPSRFRLYRRFGAADPRAGWTEHRRGLAAVHQRITDRAELIDALIGPGRATRAIRRLAKELDTLEQRLELVSLPKTRRWAQALRLWRDGFYESYSGWRSALKDSLVP